MKRKVCFIVLVLLVIISFVFPVKSNLFVPKYKGEKTAIDLDNNVYTFNIKADNSNFNMIRFRFTTFDTDKHEGTIHYKLVDGDKVLFDKSMKISDYQTNSYIVETFENIKQSKNKEYKFTVYYDDYVESDDRFGVWVSLVSNEDNYLLNDNKYGLEAYVKEDMSNLLIPYLLLISLVIYSLYLVLERK